MAVLALVAELTLARVPVHLADGLPGGVRGRRDEVRLLLVPGLVLVSSSAGLLVVDLPVRRGSLQVELEEARATVPPVDPAPTAQALATKNAEIEGLKLAEASAISSAGGEQQSEQPDVSAKLVLLEQENRVLREQLEAERQDEDGAEMEKLEIATLSKKVEEMKFQKEERSEAAEVEIRDLKTKLAELKSRETTA